MKTGLISLHLQNCLRDCYGDLCWEGGDARGSLSLSPSSSEFISDSFLGSISTDSL